MIKNRRLSKALSNVALFDLTSKIQYKMAEKQGHLIKIDTWFPSSKTCSNCGSVKAELSLGTRTYETKELLRNAQELCKIKTVEIQIRLFIA